MAIHAGWNKGLAEGHFEEEIVASLHRAKDFVAYSDKKLYPKYDKLFKKEYPYIMKIASGYHHSMADLLKVHPDPAPFGAMRSDAPPLAYSLRSLGMSYGCVHLLDIQPCTPTLERVIHKLSTIIHDDYPGKTKPASYVVQDEMYYLLTGDSGQRFGFDPLGEVVNCHDYKLDPSGGLRERF
ncbi:hypothetical protein Tco_1243097 [Tanacetum coccineum]